MKFQQINHEVFYTTDEITIVSKNDITFLKTKAFESPKKRARLCTHLDSSDRLHEMLIALGKDTYIQPHKHFHKSESFHIIEGRLAIIIFDDYGNITEIVTMGDYLSGDTFYYRLVGDYFHTVVVFSEYAVFHEATNGPFNSEDTIYAVWAPRENQNEAKMVYMDSIAEFLWKHKCKNRITL